MLVFVCFITDYNLFSLTGGNNFYKDLGGTLLKVVIVHFPDSNCVFLQTWQLNLMADVLSYK